MTRTRRMTAIEVEQILQQYGFVFVSQKGSHRKWRQPDSSLQVIVPFHKGRDLLISTMRNIMLNASIPDTE
ncbi:MAG: type II toxin-antitoxin system HicA family toxin [Myxacorys chilensis ATA2-1-KO14]|nr:type II toxin-antitoxin system HicA family toxin [Myxacorys chilensis ATA2-1-KO14]